MNALRHTLLEIRDLNVSFHLDEGAVRALRGVSFAVPAGKTVALVGESGSGKSVTAQCIMGILPRKAHIDTGHIFFDDPDNAGHIVDLASLRPDGAQMRQIRGGRISIVFQEPMTSLSPLHTVGNQIGEAIRLHQKVSDTEARKLGREMLGRVGFPDPGRALRTYPFELSGGLRQRAMIAMALACRPALLIADEPTTALDVTIQAQILRLLKDLQDQLGMAVLLITHDLGVVANLADQVVVMYHGEIMESGTAEDLFRDPRHPYLKGLFNAAPRTDANPATRLTPLREIAVDSSGLGALPSKGKSGNDDHPRGFARKPDSAPMTPGALLTVRGLGKAFTLRSGGWFGGGERQAQAVSDVSFDVMKGECLGLVGESGCGKTTLGKMIMRAIKPDSGDLLFRAGGEEIDLLRMGRRELAPMRRRIQFVFQDPFSSLNPRMTVGELVAEPLRIHGIGDRKSRTEEAGRLLKLVGLERRHMQRYPHSFSGGQRQRIGIARALALRPELLICDEPVSALDVSIQAQVLNLIKDLQSNLGLTYLFVSHNLAVVNYVADRIAVMCAGRLVEVAPRADLFRAPRHPYTKALLAAIPEPELDRRLDLTALLEGRASNPESWPKPYRIADGAAPVLVEISPGHWVRRGAPARTPEVAAQ